MLEVNEQSHHSNLIFRENIIILETKGRLFHFQKIINISCQVTLQNLEFLSQLSISPFHGSQ